MKIGEEKMELIILYLNLFFPIFSNIIGVKNGSVILIMIIFFTSTLLLIIRKNIKINKFIYYISIFYIFMITISVLFNIDTLIFKDFFEYQRPILCILAVCCGKSYSQRKNEIDILKDVKNIGYLFIIINIYKFFDKDSIFFQLYQRERLAMQNRIAGTFISPYDYAYFLIFYFYLYFEEYFSFGKKKQLFMSILVFISILLTQSRSQFITYIMSLVFYIILKIYQKNSREKIINIIIKCVCGTIIIVSNYMEEISVKLRYLYLGLKNIFTNGITADPSSNIRYNQILLAIEEFKILGNSSNKKSGLLFENQYILYLYRYGLMGMIYNFMLIGYLFIFTFKILRKKRESILVIAYSIFIFSLPIAFLANNIIDQLRINYFFYFLFGVMLGIEKGGKKSDKSFNNYSSL